MLNLNTKLNGKTILNIGTTPELDICLGFKYFFTLLGS
jgi:hypothetical protein